ncbi:MAG: cytochrome c [Chloroflexi bacterium]|nr:cytochrome c [Chloroflexota bacterium]
MKYQLLRTGGRLSIGFIFLALIIFLWLPSLSLSAQEQVVPTTVGDAERGLLLYQERCASCHGISGGGDGELAPQAINPPRVFNDPDFRYTAVPTLMFDTIVNGRIDAGMPPYGSETSNPLPDEAVWDLIAAVYSFSTPAESIGMGEALFAEYVNPDTTVDLTDLSLWATESNESMVTYLSNLDFLVEGTEIGGVEWTALVDYARGSFSYTYADPFAAAVPIETAVIYGEVRNGTTDEIVEEGVATLRAFTMNLEESMLITTTVETDGTFTFNLTDVPQEWIYLVSAEYAGFRFSSVPSLMDAATPELELPVTVYEQSDNSVGVIIEQVHVILSFFEESVEVVELYRFGNFANSIFIGETGTPEGGTVQFMVPAGAENVTFERSLGSMENFAPAVEVIPTENGWADTLPLRPGTGVLDMLVTYVLPYDDELEIAHPLPYVVDAMTLILPDVGIEVEGGEWELQGQDEFANSQFLSYANMGADDADALSLTLTGTPTQIADHQGIIQPVRNESADLIVGGASLAVAVGAAVYVMKTWRDGDNTTTESPENLLAAIVALDDAYENGNIDVATYEAEREALKASLLDVWSREDR